MCQQGSADYQNPVAVRLGRLLIQGVKLAPVNKAHISRVQLEYGFAGLTLNAAFQHGNQFQIPVQVGDFAVHLTGVQAFPAGINGQLLC